MSVDINWIKEKFGISDEAIKGKIAEEIQPRIEEAERVRETARQTFESKQEELRQAQSEIDRTTNALNALYAERDASFQG